MEKTPRTLFLIGFLLIGLNTASDAVVIESKPVDKVLQKDADPSDPLMECKTDGDAVMDWKRDSTGTFVDVCKAETGALDAPTCTDAAFEVDIAKRYNLKLKSPNKVAFAHSGNYKCTVTGATLSPASGKLTVVDIPKCSPTAVDAIEGVKKEIECTVEYRGETVPVVTIGGETTVQTESGADTKTTTAKFEITPTEDKKYECASTTGTGDKAVKGTCDITVTVKKIINVKPIDTVAMIGAENVGIDCTVVAAVTGYGTITWENGKKDVKCTGTEAGEQTCTPATNHGLDKESKHDLIIKKVTEDSADTYSCSFDNLATPYTVNLIPIEDKNPVCTKSDKKLICKVTFKGDKAPIVQWHKADVDVKATGTVDGQVVTLETEVDDEKVNYMCRVMNGEVNAYECVGHTASGAPALDARIYQSTLLSLVVVWMRYQFK